MSWRALPGSRRGDAPIIAHTELRARPRSGADTYRHAMAELANASAKMIHNPLDRSIHAAMFARPNLRTPLTGFAARITGSKRYQRGPARSRAGARAAIRGGRAAGPSPAWACEPQTSE